MATFSEIVTQIEQKKFAPIYLLDGDEPFYIDRLMQQFEHKVLNPEERDFNLITLYGKETNAHEVIQAARRFPMFAEHTVVLLKEANQMKSIQELVAYVDQPLSSTILVLEHRFSKIDGRGGKLLKAIAGKGVHFNSMKIRESDVPRWTIDFGKSMKIKIGDREAEMLTVFLGNDLQKIANELEKVKINEPNLEQLTVAHIEKYMGVNREYNVFEFPATLFLGDRARLARMLQYFSKNPKVASFPVLIGSLYSFLNKAFLSYYVPNNPQSGKKWSIWEQHRRVANKYSLPQLHRCLAILAMYSAKSVGIDSNHSDPALVQELTARLLHQLNAGKNYKV